MQFGESKRRNDIPKHGTVVNDDRESGNVICRHVSISLGSGKLAASVHLPVKRPAPVIVCSHGLLSSKQSSKFQTIGEFFSAGGFAVIRFDYTGCGHSTTDRLQSLLATRLRDLEAVIEYSLSQPWAAGGMGLLGSSFGGYLSALIAAKRPQLIRSVVCWATPFDLNRIECRLGFGAGAARKFPADYAVGSPLTLEQLPAISGVLVVHGQADELVPWDEAVTLYRKLGEPRQLVLMEGVDHRFLDPAWRHYVIHKSLAWFCNRFQ